MGLLSGLFESIAKAGPAPRSTEPNVANKIAAHIRAKWPELVGVPGLWFSGSQVWSFLYDKEPPADSDWDIFVCKNAAPVVSYEGGFLGSPTRTERAPLEEALYRIKPLKVTPRQPPNPMYSSNGSDVETERGDIDVWTSEAESPQRAIRDYPASHSHCRAAFSFTEGLVVLPNEAAQ